MLKTLQAFDIHSIPKTIALCIFTFGLFVTYRLFTLTTKTNLNTGNPISTVFIYSATIMHLVAFLSLITHFTISGPTELLLFSKAMHFISSVFHVVWIIRIRNRINSLSGARKGSQFWLSPFLSTFFHVIYIQYKINQSVSMEMDRTSKNDI